MMAQQNTALVTEWFRRLAEGDYAGLHELHTQDIVWDVLSGASEGIVPWLGVFRGRAGVEDCLAKFAGAVESERFETREMLTGEGGLVAVLGHTDLIERKTRTRLRIEFVEFFRLREGKIAYVRVFGDTAGARDIFRARG